MGDLRDMNLIYSLVGYPSETEWIEFKENNADATRIGHDISALANAAAYHGHEFAYKLWGIEDQTHALKGTTFRPVSTKAQGNQDLLIWLRQHLSGNANYEFLEIDDEGNHYVVLKIFAAVYQPVCFNNVVYIREGSSTTALKSGSAKEAELWRRLQQSDFEERIAQSRLTQKEVYELLDVDAYFRLLNLRQPSADVDVMDALQRQHIILREDDGCYAISNLGALLVARQLSVFSGLRKRVLRVVRFEGKGRASILEDRFIDKGYAFAIPEAVECVMGFVPSEEVLEGAFRRVRHMFPRSAVRELVSNAVIHQDLNEQSASPEVHVFENRLEFVNPGAMLVPEDRVVNAQPKTRNRDLVRILRQMDLCEEEGTGWDIVIAACEEFHLLSPKIRSDDDAGTEVTLFGETAYARMTKAERKMAAYWHACLMLSQDEALTNQSLRERFGLETSQKNMVSVSRLIRECCDDGLLKEEDPDAGRKNMRYMPAWA